MGEKEVSQLGGGGGEGGRKADVGHEGADGIASDAGNGDAVGGVVVDEVGEQEGDGVSVGEVVGGGKDVGKGVGGGGLGEVDGLSGEVGGAEHGCAVVRSRGKDGRTEIGKGEGDGLKGVGAGLGSGPFGPEGFDALGKGVHAGAGGLVGGQGGGEGGRKPDVGGADGGMGDRVFLVVTVEDGEMGGFGSGAGRGGNGEDGCRTGRGGNGGSEKVVEGVVVGGKEGDELRHVDGGTTAYGNDGANRMGAEEVDAAE